jgi:hypothetical protein
MAEISGLHSLRSIVGLLGPVLGFERLASLAALGTNRRRAISPDFIDGRFTLRYGRPGARGRNRQLRLLSAHA